MNGTNGEKCEKYDCLESFQVINYKFIDLRGWNMLYHLFIPKFYHCSYYHNKVYFSSLRSFKILALFSRRLQKAGFLTKAYFVPLYKIVLAVHLINTCTYINVTFSEIFGLVEVRR